MNFQNFINYPIKIKICDGNNYIFTSIDYPECSVKSDNYHQGINEISEKLEELVWDLSKSNAPITNPSNLLNLDKRIENNSFYSEVKIKRCYGELPDILYYYLPASEILFKTLTTPYVWFSDPKTFNDPFELPEAFEKNWTKDEEWKDFEFSFNSKKGKLDIFEHFETAQEAYLQLKFKEPSILKNILELKLEALDDAMSQFGIACFSRYYDNVLMWSHYSNKHTGVVIGYRYDRIVHKNSELIGGDVDYRIHKNKLRTGKYAGELESVLESDFLTRKLFTKHPCWSYEQEYRLLNPNSAGEKYPIDKESICELHLGCEIDPDIKSSLLEIVSGTNIELFDMIKSDDSNLLRVSINSNKKTR
jgi:hypothetical protein